MKASIVVISCASLGLLSSRLIAMVKKAVEPKQKFRVVLEFDIDSIQEIDRQVYELSIDGKASRASVCKAIVEHAINQGYSTKEDQVRAYHKLLKKAMDLREQATRHTRKKDFRSAASLYLQSASVELEALYVMKDRNEGMIKSALIQVVQAIKQGTGYKTLPDIPESRLSVELSS